MARDIDGASSGSSSPGALLFNGSMVLQLASLTLGQKLLRSRLGPLAARLTTERSFRREFARVFSPEHPLSDEEAADQWALITHDGGRRIGHRLDPLHGRARTLRRALARRGPRLARAADARLGPARPGGTTAVLDGLRRAAPGVPVDEAAPSSATTRRSRTRRRSPAPLEPRSPAPRWLPDGRLRSGEGRPPNILLVITDQQRHPRHWPTDPGWLEELMPNDAELARTGLTFTNAFCNTAMCSPSRATLLTGRYPARHGVTLTLTAADLHPDPRNAPDVLRRWRGSCAAGEAPRERVLTQFVRGRAAARAAAPATSRCSRRDRATSPRCFARPGTRSPTRASGTSPSRSGRRAASGWPSRRERDRARLRLRRLGAARRGRERQGGELRRRQRRTRQGLGRGVHAPGRALARPARPARAVLPGRLARQPARRARLPALLRARRLRAPTSSATSASRCRRPSTRTSRQARPSSADADRG